MALTSLLERLGERKVVEGTCVAGRCVDGRGTGSYPAQGCWSDPSEVWGKQRFSRLTNGAPAAAGSEALNVTCN